MRCPRPALKHIQVCSFVNPKRVPGMADADDVVQRFQAEARRALHRAVAQREGVSSARWRRSSFTLEGKISATPRRSSRCATTTARPRENIDGAARRDRHLQGARHSGHQRRRHGGVRLQLPGRHAASRRIIDIVAADLRARGRERHRAEEHLARRHDGVGDAGGRSSAASARCARDSRSTASSLHLHDTRGMGIANAYAGLEMGVDMFDTASRASAAARSPATRARPATSAPRTSCSCARRWASRPASTSTS